MKKSVEIEEALHDAYKETDLLKFEAKLALEKQLTRVEHFNVVTDDELMSYGMSAPAVRRFRAILKKKAAKKGKNKIFTLGKKTGNQSKLIIAQFEAEERHQNGPETPTPSTPCLIGREEIKLMETLGEGTFAVVKRAIWNKPTGQKVDCAVKILREISEEMKADLHAEIMNMQKLRHTNLIQLYGIVYGEPTLMVIEFCNGGALLDRLRDPNKPVLLATRLLNYAQQIASGMAYLESRRCVHRDLAARNVLLAENDEIVKICDFGMTRHLNENERLYVMSGMKKVPFSWCPPESLSRRQFSHQSDVWAFGVLLWELYTYGEEPWAGYRAADVLRMTEAGERLKQPEKSSKELYDLMTMCWQLQPENRPKFSLLRQLLKEIRFTTADCRSEHPAESPTELGLSIGDHVIIISERDKKNWYGQSTKSGLFGTFSRSVVALKTSRQLTTNNLSPTKESSRISLPVPGSFIHTGHGDIDEKNTWGYVEKIDPIYLHNPILRPSNINTSPRMNFIPSAAALDGTPKTFPMPTKNSTNKISSPKALPKPPGEKLEANIKTTNFSNQFDDDFSKPRSFSHEHNPVRSSSAIPFQQPLTISQPFVLPPRQRLSPPPKPSRRPVSITPETQPKTMKVLEPAPMAAPIAKSHSSSMSNVNFRPTPIVPPPPPQVRQTAMPTTTPTTVDNENKRNTVIGGVKSLDHLQRQKDAFSWMNLDTITQAREKIMHGKAESQPSSSSNIPKVNSSDAAPKSTPVTNNIVPKKQTTPPPILAENFIAARSMSFMPTTNNPSTSNGSVLIPTKTLTPIIDTSRISKTTTTTTPTPTTSSAPSTVRLPASTVPFSNVTTHSAPSSVRVATTNDKFQSPERARPLASIFPPPNKTMSATKPIANIQPMPVVPSPIFATNFPDPFLISDDVKTLAAKARYSQVHTKLVPPTGIYAGGGVGNGISNGYSLNSFMLPSSSNLINGTIPYTAVKPSTGLYPTMPTNLHIPQSSSSSSESELLYPSLSEPISKPLNGMYPTSSIMPAKTGLSTTPLNIPPSSDELFPESKTENTNHTSVDTSRPASLLLASKLTGYTNNPTANNRIFLTTTSTTSSPLKTPAQLTHVTSAPSISIFTQPTTKPSTSTGPPSAAQTKSLTNNYSSLLPPPSPLLLSGQSATPTTSSTLLPPPSSLFVTQNSTPMNFSHTMNAPKAQNLPLQPTPLYVAGNSSSNTASLYGPSYIFNYNNPSAQFSNWPMSQPTTTLYSPNGPAILQPTRPSGPPPVLQPIPAMPIPISTSSTPISLDFLDISSNSTDDEAIAKVRSLFDSASVDKCRQFLKMCNGDVNRTVRELKILQLLEIGIAGDRELAISALDSCQWDVNAAAERLLTF